MTSFSVMGIGVIAGGVIGTLLYVFFWETTLRQKAVVAVIYGVSWGIDHVFETNFPIGLLMQIALCIYYAFWYKQEMLA